jgi:hypothetical protein
MFRSIFDWRMSADGQPMAPKILVGLMTTTVSHRMNWTSFINERVSLSTNGLISELIDFFLISGIYFSTHELMSELTGLFLNSRTSPLTGKIAVSQLQLRIIYFLSELCIRFVC